MSRSALSSLSVRGDASKENGDPLLAELGQFGESSFQSLGSGPGSVQAVGQVAGSSKAVLAALRALQDKIRRLEIERSQALEEAAQLRQQVKHYEIEIEHTKQREALANQKVMAEATATKERLYTEKAELEVKLARFEDRCTEQTRAIGDLEFKLRVLEDEKTKAEGRARALEAQVSQSATREKDVAQTVVWETKRHEDEVEALQAHISSLTHDVSSALDKNHELDSMVRQLLASNEALTGQLAKAEKRARAAAAAAAAAGTTSAAGGGRDGKGGKAAAGAKKGPVRSTSAIGTRSATVTGRKPAASSQVKKTAKKSRAVDSSSSLHLPHCATVSTAAAEAQRTSKVESNPSHWVPGGLRGVDVIHSLDAGQLSSSQQSLPSTHSVLSARVSAPPPMPRKAPSPSRSAGSGSRSGGRARANSVDSRDSRASSVASSGSNASASARAARTESRKPVSGSGGSSVGIAMAAGSAKHGKSRSNSTSSVAAASTAASFWDGYDVLGSSQAAARSSPSSGSKAASKASGAPPKVPKAAATTKASAAVLSGITAAAAATLGAPAMSASPSRSRPEVGTADSFAKARDSDLQQVIQSLEEEFSSLNSQYRSLLKTVSSPGIIKSQEDPLGLDGSFEADEREGLLVDVIQRMHKKSEQLKLVRGDR